MVSVQDHRSKFKCITVYNEVCGGLIISTPEIALLEIFYKPVSKLYQNLYVFTGSGTIFTNSSIILILIYEFFPIVST